MSVNQVEERRSLIKRLMPGIDILPCLVAIVGSLVIAYSTGKTGHRIAFGCLAIGMSLLLFVQMRFHPSFLPNRIILRTLAISSVVVIALALIAEA